MTNTATPVTQEQLQCFCSTDESRVHKIGRPWTRDGYTYATNGMVLIRVPAMPDVPDNEMAPTSEGIRRLEWHDPIGLAPMPELPAPDLRWCTECNGVGYMRNANPPENGDVCDECDGTGTQEVSHSVAIGGRKLDVVFLRKIAALPNAMIETVGEARSAAAFVFDGGDGLLMPLRYSDQAKD